MQIYFGLNSSRKSILKSSQWWESVREEACFVNYRVFMGTIASRVLICGYNNESKEKNAKLSPSSESSEPLTEEDLHEDGGLTPIAPCNTPVEGVDLNKKGNIKEVLNNVSRSFSCSTQEVLDLAQALDEGMEDDDMKGTENRVDIQNLLFQSPYFMRSRQRLLENESFLSFDEAPYHGRNITNETMTHGQSPTQYTQLCSPYSDMTSIKSEMLPITERLVNPNVAITPNRVYIKENPEHSVGEYDGMCASSDGCGEKLDTTKSEETTHETSMGSNSSDDSVLEEKEKNDSSKNSSPISSVTISQTSLTNSSEYITSSSAGSDLRVKPGKKYTFRRRVGKAASFLLNAGKKRQKGSTSHHVSESVTPNHISVK